VKAKNDGKALQRLIRAIESALAAGNETVKVEMSKRLPDKVTGKLREHDVVLTITNNHHETIIALECRDRSRRVGVDAVEAFHNKCQDTGISSGIIVSASGFWKSAVEKATHYNIGCLSLTEAEGFDWCIATGLTNFSRKLIHTHLGVIFPGPSAVEKDNVRTADGTPLNHQIVTRWAANAQPVPSGANGRAWRASHTNA
jgi:predicted helicase